jgi:hypothetical protein
MTTCLMTTIVLVLTSMPAFAQGERPVELSAFYLTVGGTMHGRSYNCWPACCTRSQTRTTRI